MGVALDRVISVHNDEHASIRFKLFHLLHWGMNSVRRWRLTAINPSATDGPTNLHQRTARAPEFVLNIHNQRARTSVWATGPCEPSHDFVLDG